ncbi:MAG TPA: hypothetical protein VK980_15415 [Sphingomonas sp.]|nr:hypothetical protein [Sphingomonas sp.]
MGRFLSLMLVWFAAGLLAALGTPAAGQGVGPTKSVKLVFLGFDNVDVQLWIDGQRVVARHMVVPDQSIGLSLMIDGQVKRKSQLVVIAGKEQSKITIGSVTRLKTIYIAPHGTVRFSPNPPGLD